MANEQNLIPVTKRTKSEARKISKKGGKKSAEARRKRKTFADLINSYNDKPFVINEQLKQKLETCGIENPTNKDAIIFGQIIQAIQGSTQAFIAIRDTIGEQPTQKVENVNPPTIKIERPDKK